MIYKAADCSSESVFTKFYYKPTRDVSFGEAVLSTSVDIETEHSDIREYGSTLYVGMAPKKNGHHTIDTETKQKTDLLCSRY